MSTLISRDEVLAVLADRMDCLYNHSSRYIKIAEGYKKSGNSKLANDYHKEAAVYSSRACELMILMSDIECLNAK